MFSELQAALTIPFFGIEFRTYALALLIILASILFRTIIADLIFAGLRKLMIRQEKPWHHKLLSAIEQPVASFVLFLGLAIAADTFPLTALWHHRVDVAFRILVTITAFWGLIRANNVGAEILGEHGKKKGLSVATFIPLFRQIINIIIIIIALIIIIDKLGYSVSSIIAALGIGGAALAFASQSTIANLYGSIAIALDRPFKVGDTIEIKDFKGSVEAIGLRSTQIRTDSNTLVSIPNNIVATEAVDNHTQRPNRRIRVAVGLTYGTKKEQIEGIIADMKAMMASMKNELAPEPQRAQLIELASSSINVELICCTESASIKDYFKIRQTILFNVMEIVEKNGASFAYPTQTIHLARETPALADK